MTSPARLPLLLAALAAAAPVRAQELGARARVAPPLPATNPLDPTAAGSSASGQDADAAERSMPELLLQLPGVDVRQSGASGARAYLALRGAAANQTAVMLEDLPFGGGEGGAFDLALLAAPAFGAVEVYRGGAPAWLDSGAIGGVLRLRAAALGAPAARFRLGLGSFGAWQLGAESHVSSERLRVTTSVGVDGARNDFPFADDAGTSLDGEDDGESRRVNAHTLGAFGLAHVVADVGDAGELSAVILGTQRQGGDPGPAQNTAEATRRQDVRLSGNAAYLHRFERGRLQVAAGGGVHQQRVSDPEREIGLDFNENEDRFADAMVRVAGSATLHPWLEATGVASTRWAGFRPDNSLGAEIDDSRRVASALTGELRAHGHALGVGLDFRVSARVEHQRTEAGGIDRGFGRQEIVKTSHRRPTIRAAAAVAPLPWLSLVGSVATGTRFPTFLELFGDAGAVLPNIQLGPERSRSVDAGFVMRGRKGPVRGTFEVRYFDLRIDEVVRPRLTSQFTVIFQNAGDARSRGVELGGRARFGPHVALAGTLTRLRTQSETGNALPWRPELQAQAQPELHLGPRGPLSDAVFFASVFHRGDYFNDPANLVRIPGRTWLGMGVRVDLRLGLSALFTVRDLLDQRGQDFLGFPLPGRRYAAELRYSMEL
ncbi:MAG: TonB-dependent receptor [Myxococcota bacterium]